MRVVVLRSAAGPLRLFGVTAPPAALALAVASALRAAGDEVEVVTLDGLVVPDTWSAGVQGLASWLAANHPQADTVHALDVVAAAAALAARRETGARVVVRAQAVPAGPNEPRRVLWPLVLRAADAVVAPTAADAREAVMLGARAGTVVRCLDGALLASAICDPVAPMVDETRCEPYLLAMSGVPEDPRTAQELVRAAVVTGRRLVVASPSARDETSWPFLRFLAGKHGVQARVETVGRLGGPDLFDLVDRCEVVIATRSQPSCGLAPLVAMRRARPVIAVGGATAAEVVVDGITGRLVDPAVPYEMASAVEDLVGAPFRRLAWGVAGRDRVESCFAPEQVARALATAHEITAA